jgi:hypothetical protein
VRIAGRQSSRRGRLQKLERLMIVGTDRYGSVWVGIGRAMVGEGRGGERRTRDVPC